MKPHTPMVWRGSEMWWRRTVMARLRRLLSILRGTDSLSLGPSGKQKAGPRRNLIGSLLIVGSVLVISGMGYSLVISKEAAEMLLVLPFLAALFLAWQDITQRLGR